MAFGNVMHMDLTIPNADEVRDFYQAVAGWGSMGLSMGDYDDYVMMDVRAGLERTPPRGAARGASRPWTAKSPSRAPDP
jgi:hypothetical protein